MRSEQSKVELERALTAQVRLSAALGSTPIGQSEAGARLARWLIGDVARVPETEAFVTIDLARDVAMGMIGGSTATMIGPLGDHLGLLDAPDDEVAHVRALGERLEPGAVSLWLEAAPEGSAAGWAFHGELAAAVVLAALPESAARDGLVRASVELGLDVVSELRVAVGVDAAFVRLPLPATLDAGQAAQACARALDIDAFALSDIATLTAGPGAELVVGLNDTGVCGFGISVDAIAVEALIAISDRVAGDARALAAFEGMLAPSGERAAMLWRDARGVRVLVTYRAPLGSV